jgi:hypothetical protein
MDSMSCDGSITPADLVSELDWLIVSCEKCGRSGRYSVAPLVKQLGPHAKLTDWHPEGDCPRRKSLDMSDQCGACCPDLPKVLQEGPKRELLWLY